MKELYTKFLDLIRSAGNIMTAAIGKDADENVKEKGGDPSNFVTEYDVGIQNYLIEKVREIVPDAAFIAEEKDNDPAVLCSEHCFIIDPIDGTTNFVRGHCHSCVSFEMISFGKPVFGAVYDPYLDEMFYAVQGDGAYLNGKRMKVSSRDMRHALLSYGTAPYYKEELGEKTFKIAYKLFSVCADVRRQGSAALDLAYLAAGRNDIFFELRLSPWDIAAGCLLIKEAGGKITDKDGCELDLKAPTAVFASNGILHSELLSVINNKQ